MYLSETLVREDFWPDSSKAYSNIRLRERPVFLFLVSIWSYLVHQTFSYGKNEIILYWEHFIFRFNYFYFVILRLIYSEILLRMKTFLLIITNSCCQWCILGTGSISLNLLLPFLFLTTWINVGWIPRMFGLSSICTFLNWWGVSGWVEINTRMW